MSLTNAQVAAAVRAELARAQVTGRQLARETGLPAGLVQRRLAGKEPGFQIDELGKIAAYLGVPVATFVTAPEPTAAAS